MTNEKQAAVICDFCRLWTARSWDQWSIRQENMHRAQHVAEIETKQLGYQVLAPAIYPCPHCGGTAWATATPPSDAPLSLPSSPLLRYIIGALIAAAVGFVTALTLVTSNVFGAERVQCAAEPVRPIRTHWSWRAGIDGRPERCWFRGYMRPASELTWGENSSSQAVEQPGSGVPFPAPGAASTEENDIFKRRWPRQEELKENQ